MRSSYILIATVVLSLAMVTGQALADDTCSSSTQVKSTASTCYRMSESCPFSLSIIEPTGTDSSVGSCGYSVRGVSNSLFTTLKRDHDEIEKQMAVISKNGCASAESWAQLKGSLLSHNQAEESAIYPVLLHAAETQPHAAMRLQEHAGLAAMVAKLDEIPVTDCRWMPSFKALRSAFIQNIRAEESGTFPAARAAIAEMPFCSIYSNYMNNRETVLTGMTSEIRNDME